MTIFSTVGESAAVNEPADHDATPPDDLLQSTLLLSLIPDVGPRTYKLLIERFGSPQAVLAAGPAELREVRGVGPKLCRQIVQARETLDPAAELELCRQNDITVLTQADPEYPRLLREIPDPPAVLFVKGALLANDALAVAIVGTRHATRYGLDQAERLAAGLARAGLTVVSGLARGVDGAAHRAALEAGGRTIAVLASGLLKIFPPEHQELSQAVTNHGAILSEAPPTREPLSGMFPPRNRLITGLSLGLIVVEAADRSGALISARHAMEQNREVFAVPGRIDSRMSRGCHGLIRDGARLVSSVDDVLEELGPLVEPARDRHGREVRHAAELQLNDQERQVLDAIEIDATSIDQVAASSGLPVQRVLATLSVLEVRRLVRRIGGNQVSRVPGL
jgi:DNA processing protein